MKRHIWLLFVWLFACVLSAKSQTDSALTSHQNTTEKQKTQLILELALKTREDTARSNVYSRMAYRLAVKNKQIPLQAMALFTLGENLYNSSDFHLAIPEYQKALTIFATIKDTANVVNCYKLIGLCYYNIDQGDKAIVQFLEGMKLCEHDPETTAKLLSNIAMAHSRMRNLNDAISYYRKALSINSSIRNFDGMAVNLNGLGEIYKSKHRPDSALANYLRAKKLVGKNTYLQAVTSSNIAGIYIINYRDSVKKAIPNLEQAWATFRRLGMYQYEAEFKQNIGIILFKEGHYPQAIQALKNSIEINDKYKRGFKIKATSNNLLSKVYERLGDYNNSLKYMKLYVVYSDSMAQKEKYDRISALEKSYEFEKKESQIASLKAKQELTLVQLRKNKQLKQLGLTSAFLLLMLLFFIWLKYLDKIKSNKLLASKNKVIEKSEQELRVLNASKNKFFSIIAHDLKNPLHTVLGYSSLLYKDYDKFKETERRKFASDIFQSTNNIFRLLQNLLEWSRSQTGALNFSPDVVEYQRVLDNSLSVLRSLAEQKGIQIKTGHDPELKLFADPLMIETVLRNLINNAIKFTPNGGYIEVSAKQADGQIQISVTDTGVGISEEESQNLFRIDSKVKRKGTNNEDGTGLGLILCHEFVNKHQGKIWVESTPGKGSEFIFTIPAKATA